MDLTVDIETVLSGAGLAFRKDDVAGVPVVAIDTADGHRKIVLPLEVRATSMSEADSRQAAAAETVSALKSLYGQPPIIITEDRWRRNREAMALRMMAHLGVFDGIFARNCTVSRISRSDISGFLEDNHSYGDAKSRHHYGIFHKGELVGAAEFSGARKWRKESSGTALTIRSYEWVRYASLPGTRIIGGMGKVLKKFIGDIRPDDIMSYADLEWSEGSAYSALGFECEGFRQPVMFTVGRDYVRTPLADGEEPEKDLFFFKNFGSMKYRLKLTDYR